MKTPRMVDQETGISTSGTDPTHARRAAGTLHVLRAGFPGCHDLHQMVRGAVSGGRFRAVGSHRPHIRHVFVAGSCSGSPLLSLTNSHAGATGE